MLFRHWTSGSSRTVTPKRGETNSYSLTDAFPKRGETNSYSLMHFQNTCWDSTRWGDSWVQEKLKQLQFTGQRIPEENPAQRPLEMCRGSPEVFSWALNSTSIWEHYAYVSKLFWHHNDQLKSLELPLGLNFLI